MFIENPGGFAVKHWLISSYSYSTVFTGLYSSKSLTYLALRMVL